MEFQNAPALRRLLQYLWQNRDKDLNEYAIATEALGRRPDFDPKVDAVVRVNARRIRRKLKEYYEGEGASSQLRLTLPLGHHSLQVERVKAPAAKPTSPRRAFLLLLLAITTVSVTATLILALQNRRLRQAAEAARPPLDRFWAAFLNNGLPTSLVVPTPLFVQWQGLPLRLRDYRINEFGTVNGSDELTFLIKRYGRPTLSQSYSVMADTLAVGRLVPYLSARGAPITVVSDHKLSLDAFGNQNVMFLGIPNTSTYLRQFLQRATFELLPSGNRVANRNPKPGEPAEFQPEHYSNSRQKRPTLLALLPGKTPGTRILLVAGHTAALASFLISPGGLEALDAEWSRNGSPEFYEVVVTAELDGQTLVRAAVAAFRTVSN